MSTFQQAKRHLGHSVVIPLSFNQQASPLTCETIISLLAIMTEPKAITNIMYHPTNPVVVGESVS